MTSAQSLHLQRMVNIHPWKLSTLTTLELRTRVMKAIQQNARVLRLHA